MTNAFSIDFEDWYQGLEIPASGWGGFERRIRPVAHRLLDLLADAGVRGTFFVLGHLAEEHPEVVREVAAAGHEIGTHGLSHTLIYRQQPAEFREELKRAVGVVEDLTGKRVRGHRAPFFSITKDSLWALEILVEQGIEYDSSIFPTRNYRYGMVAAPRWPHRMEVGDGTIIEAPLSIWRLRGANLPVGGGAYFRILPYGVTRRAFRSIIATGHPVIFYLHPWELDPAHPRIELPRRIAATHYFNLRSTEGRLRRLLRDFSFAPMEEVLGLAG